MKDLCPASGKQGRMEEIPGSDDWYITCPICGMRWAGGSLILTDHGDLRQEFRPDKEE